ncbi:hypothetical protein BJ875DRAFT_517224 [Amylocarpus encephaloides]|uniref:Uncharacterized protein n=1 Tax=Amylocarpus encephaloides TaxID=45428 RepID=A0A9P7YQ94_9HELO|nr:hypothetical protein BJ875DRAFT_517224 [Amylocarpus encephaloides]
MEGLGYGMSGGPFSGGAVGGHANAISMDPITQQRIHAIGTYCKPIHGGLARQDMTVIGKAVEEYMKKSGPFASAGNFAGGLLYAVCSYIRTLAEVHTLHLPRLGKLSWWCSRLGFNFNSLC